MAELNDRTNRERAPETSCQAQTNKAPSQLDFSGNSCSAGCRNENSVKLRNEPAAAHKSSRRRHVGLLGPANGWLHV